MKSMKKLMLPLLIAGSFTAIAPQVMAAPTIIPSFQMAQAKPEGAELHKSPNGADGNMNGKPDSQDSVGVKTLGDNTNDNYDGNDSKDGTFDATFWVLMSIVGVGIVGIVAYATRRKGVVSPQGRA